MKKKWLWMCAAFVLSGIALAGCGTKKDEKNADASGEISMWTIQPPLPQSASSWKEYPFLTNLQKKTGIKIDYQYPAEGADSDQAFNLMLSEEKLPDLIWYSVRNNADSYIEDGIIQDLTKILPKKAPHYWKFLQAHPEYARAMKTDSGKYFGFGFFRENPISTTYLGPMIRQDWLKEQHLSAPTNPSEWESTLKVFKKAYGARFGFTTARMTPGLAGAFGAHGSFKTQYYVEDGKVKLAQAEPEWKDYIQWLNKLYKEDLIDPDVVTMTEDNDLNAKIANNKISAAFTAGSQMTVMNTDAKTNKTTADWVGIKYPEQENGDETAAVFAEDMYAIPSISISTACKGKALDESLKWLDWAYSKDGYYFWNFGNKGDTWNMKNDIPTFTDKVTKSKLGVTEAIKTYTGSSTVGIGTQSFEATKQRNDPRTIEAMTGWYNNNTDALKAIMPAGATMTAKESKEGATLQNSIDSFVLENSLKFMTGEKSLNQYDDFIQKLNDLGLKRLLKIKQKSYDRYLNR